MSEVNRTTIRKKTFSNFTADEKLESNTND